MPFIARTARVLAAVVAIAVAAPGTAQAAVRAPKVGGGVITDRLSAAGRTYFAGSFTTVRDRTGKAVRRPYLVAYRTSNGRLLPLFQPHLDGAVRDLAVSPDHRWLYLAGSFRTASGMTSRRVAKIDASTGAADALFRPASINGVVSGVALSGQRLVITGTFSTVGGVARHGKAVLDPATGAVQP